MKPLKEGDIIYNRNGTEQEVLHVFRDGLYVLKDLASYEASVVEITEDNKGGFKEKEQTPE